MLKLLPGLYGAGEARTAGRSAVTGEKSAEAEQSRVVEKTASASDGEPEEIGAETVKSPAAPRTKTQESVKAILADRFGVTGTLGEKMSSSRKDEVVTSVMQSKPIADIAAAIGINDKFYYIRELFSGDAAAYSDAVSRLNAAASLGEAMKILDDSTVMGSDPAAQSSFVDVVRRKFSLNV
jgi:hypothetical protein